MLVPDSNTPYVDRQSAYLEQTGTLLCTGNSGPLVIKYYKLIDAIFKVVYNEGVAITIIKISQDEFQRIVSCSDLDFGDW